MFCGFDRGAGALRALNDEVGQNRRRPSAPSRGSNRRIHSLTSHSLPEKLEYIAVGSPWEMRMRCHFLQIIGRGVGGGLLFFTLLQSSIPGNCPRSASKTSASSDTTDSLIFLCSAAPRKERERREGEVFHYHLAVPISSSRGN